jgi:hypothetical protein
MAIYPYYSTTIINKDVLTASSFKAGMALITDSNGRAIKADSQQLISASNTEKYAKFLGFAASDHDISGNTLIVPDVIGSSYLDTDNRFVNNQNLEFSVPKRALMDLQDTAISNFYNASDPNIISRRGIGIYNTPGDIFLTDQFLPVLHGDYGFDNTTIQTITPGDLLTFGGGVNAGKLVKVNVNSFGPGVLVVAIVEKYIPETGILYFRQVNYGTSFTNLYLVYTDPGNTASYNGGTALNNIASLSQSFTLQNGPVASSYFISYDGTDDQAASTSLSSTITEATFIAWVWRNGNQNAFTGIMSVKLSAANMVINGTGLGYNWNNATFGWGSGLIIPDQTWSFCAVSINSALATACVNGVFSINNVAHSSTSLGYPLYLGTDSPGGSGRFLNGRISQAILINKSLTQTELTNYYNATRGRYGV